MNLEEFTNRTSVKICEENKMADVLTDVLSENTMQELIKSIEKKIQYFENENENNKKSGPPSNPEIREIQRNHERLKNATIKDLKDLQEVFEKKLRAAKIEYEKDLEFVEKLHLEKFNQLHECYDTDMRTTIHQYEAEIAYLQKQLEELANQKKRIKFQRMKTFFFREMRDAKKKVQFLNQERNQMKIKIKQLKTEVFETKLKLKDCCKNAGDAGNNYTAKRFAKVEIQFISEMKNGDETKKCDDTTNCLISRSQEIKRKLDCLNDAGCMDKIISEIVNEYSRIEMVLGHFKKYNQTFLKNSF